MSYCPKNNLLNLLRRGSKFFRKASNSVAPTAAPTSTLGQAPSLPLPFLRLRPWMISISSKQDRASF